MDVNRVKYIFRFIKVSCFLFYSINSVGDFCASSALSAAKLCIVIFHQPALCPLLLHFFSSLFRFPFSHLFMEVELVKLWEHPAHAAVSPAHQDTKRFKLLEEPQPASSESGRLTKLMGNIMLGNSFFFIKKDTKIKSTPALVLRSSGQRLERGLEAA